jgi:hypothetical protein
MEGAFIERFVFIAIISFLVIVAVKYKFRDYNKKRNQRKRFARGVLLEDKARDFLKSKGYSINSEQKIHYHKYKVNDKIVKSKLIVDYIVEKNNKKYIVEVKSGKSAISLRDKNSRRQLLEYEFVIENDGVFLLDMENKNMQLVQFYGKETINEVAFYKVLLIFAGISLLIPFWKVKILIAIILILIWQYPSKTKGIVKLFKLRSSL